MLRRWSAPLNSKLNCVNCCKVYTSAVYELVNKLEVPELHTTIDLKSYARYS